jgi:O-antigen/teichoic acid export membrane protein
MQISKKAYGIYLNPYDAFVKRTCYLVFLTVPLCILLMLFAPIIVVFFLGHSYLSLVHPLRIMFIASAFGSIATASFTHLATHPDQHPIYIRLQFLIALLKIVLVLLLSAHWGITGAAIGSTMAQILSASHSILFCRHMLLKFQFRFNLERALVGSGLAPDSATTDTSL